MDAKDYLKRHRIDDQFIKQTKYVINKGALLSEFLEDYYEMKTEALAIHSVSQRSELVCKCKEPEKIVTVHGLDDICNYCRKIVQTCG
jgi:hypothetical protein